MKIHNIILYLHTLWEPDQLAWQQEQSRNDPFLDRASATSALGDLFQGKWPKFMPEP
jgi:hypothetical protein